MIDEVGRDTVARDDSPFVTWGKALLDDPHTALDDLLSGAGTRGAQQRAELSDFLADLLAYPANEGIRPRLIDRLDTAVLKWLDGRREWSPNQIVEYRTRAYLAHVSDALAIAALLPLKITAKSMIRTLYTWDDWVRRMRLLGDIDLLPEFDMVLIQHQTDGCLTHRWFAACEEAAWGGPSWQARLRTGLLGLRKIPVTTEARPEMAVAAALVRFGVLALSRKMHQVQVEMAVRRHAGALAALYPRHEGHWRGVWAGALKLDRKSLREESASLSTVAAWLGHGEVHSSRTPGGSPDPGPELPG